MVKINDKEYAWGDIQVLLWGRPILGLKGINYSTKKEKEHSHGAGRNPKSIQHGKRTYDGDLKIMHSELIALNAAARSRGFKDILDVEIDILVSYIPEFSTKITMDRIVGASFSEFPKGMNEGDKLSEHSMPFLALDIQEDI